MRVAVKAVAEDAAFDAVDAVDSEVFDSWASLCALVEADAFVLARGLPRFIEGTCLVLEVCLILETCFVTVTDLGLVKAAVRARGKAAAALGDFAKVDFGILDFGILDFGILDFAKLDFAKVEDFFLPAPLMDDRADFAIEPSVRRSCPVIPIQSPNACKHVAKPQHLPNLACT